MNYLDKIQKDFITEIKQKIRQAQYEAMKMVNVQLIKKCNLSNYPDV